MFGDPSFLIYWIPLIIISLTIHEFSHAWVADLLGDPTPRYSGRLTLNPIPHIDPIGFIMLIVARFGWAKPVPINPHNFHDPKSGTLWVGLAGPLSNLTFAWALSVVYKYLLPSFVPPMAVEILLSAIWLNLALAVFNLIPIPPLDGSRILAGILPPDQEYILHNLEQYGFIILIAFLFFPGTHTFIYTAVNYLYQLLV